MEIIYIFIYFLISTIFAGYFFSKFKPEDYLEQFLIIVLGLMWIFILPLTGIWSILYYPTKYFGNLFDKLNNK